MVLVAGCAATALCGEIVVTTPKEGIPAKATIGDAPGSIDPGQRLVRFSKLPATASSAVITLADGTRLVGVDMRWYANAPPGDGPLSDDDRKEIELILTVPSFYDKVKILHLQGDNQHVTVLMELIRDRDFYASKGTDIIWRAELWYFEFQNGGWAKVSQENKVLDRQRFHGQAEYQKYLRILRWVPKLGDLKETPDTRKIELAAEDLIASSTIEPDSKRPK